MSGDEDSKREMIKDHEFIRQKIVRQKLSAKQKLKGLLALICKAFIFGLIASVTFAVGNFWVKSRLEKPEETIPIMIPPDENEDISQESTTAKETEPIEEIVQSAIANNELDKSDYLMLQGVLKEAATQANRSIVTVNAVKTGTDWFDNTFIQSGKTAGILIAKTDAELLIMTRADAILTAEAIEITLSSDEVFKGTVKQTDSVTNLAVLSISASEIEKELLEEIQVISLGNSLMLNYGDPLIAIGNPTGVVFSFSYGSICNIRKNVQTLDGFMRIIDTDNRTESNSASYLINLEGELVGVVNNSYQSDESTEFTSAMAISDLKELIVKMSNGNKKAYMGIKGQDITESISEATGIPIGVYVQEAVEEGAAYQAGIQSGDIIAALGDKEVTTIKDFRNQLAAHTAGEVILVKVLRGGKEAYKEIVFEVTLEAK